MAGAPSAWLNASQARSRTADVRSFQVTLLSLLATREAMQALLSFRLFGIGYTWIKTRSETVFLVGLPNIKAGVRFCKWGGMVGAVWCLSASSTDPEASSASEQE